MATNKSPQEVATTTATTHGDVAVAGGAREATLGTTTGGTGGIVVTHTTRKLKAYNFTESDLDTISTTNLVSQASFAIGAAIATFCIDINKDVILAGGQLPPTGQALQFTVNWIGIPFAIVAFGVGIFALTKRGSVIDRVKRDSENVSDQ